MRVFLVGLMASMVLATPLQARPGSSVTVRIPHGDLDLSTDQGVEQLKERSVTAIRRACSRGPVFGADANDVQEACTTQAEAEVMQQIEQRRAAPLSIVKSSAK